MGEANKKYLRNVIKLNHIWLKSWADDNGVERKKRRSSIKNTLGLISGFRDLKDVSNSSIADTYYRKNHWVNCDS